VKDYLAKVIGLGHRACELRPGNCEFKAYLLTWLVSQERYADAQQFGRKMTEECGSRPVFAVERDACCMYAAALGMDPAPSASKQAMESLSKCAQSPGAGAYVHYELAHARARKATKARERARIYNEFIRQCEEERIVARGYDFRALASAWYKVAHELNQQGSREQALAAYRRLQQISPHYAQVHYNKGVLYSLLAEEENDPQKKKQLLEDAAREYENQVRYDWQKRTADLARKQLEAVRSKLEALPAASP
jgi:tetratricopeptide (TPR) repeat protein